MPPVGVVTRGGKRGSDHLTFVAVSASVRGSPLPRPTSPAGASTVTAGEARSALLGAAGSGAAAPRPSRRRTSSSRFAMNCKEPHRRLVRPVHVHRPPAAVDGPPPAPRPANRGHGASGTTSPSVTSSRRGLRQDHRCGERGRAARAPAHAPDADNGAQPRLEQLPPHDTKSVRASPARTPRMGRLPSLRSSVGGARLAPASALLPDPRRPLNHHQAAAAGDGLVKPSIDHAELALALQQRRRTHRPSLSPGCKSGVLPVAITAPRSDDRRMFRNLWISTVNRLALTLPGPPMIHAWAALHACTKDGDARDDNPHRPRTRMRVGAGRRVRRTPDSR